MTKQSDDIPEMSPIIINEQNHLSPAKFKIGLVQIDEVQSNNKDLSPSESKETPLKNPEPIKKSAIVSPATEDYVKEDVEMLDTNLKKFEKIQGPSQREQRLAILSQQKPDDSFGSGRHKSKTFASRENTEQKQITKFEDQIEGKDRPLTAELLKKQSEDLKEPPKHVLLRDQKWMVSTFDV